MMATAEDSLVDSFLNCWVSGGVTPEPGVSDAALETFESRHHVKVPGEFKRYLQRAGGMATDTMDANRLIRFYRLDEMRTLATEAISEYRGYVTFADFMIGSHEYGIAMDGPHYGRVAILDQPRPPTVVAQSFAEFMKRYIDMPERLWQRSASEKS